MAKYALLFTIGGVQDFIASARKINDLWAGSYMLSYLIAQGIKSLPEQNELIFPSKENPLLKKEYDESILKNSLPNKFMAKIETDDIQKIASTVEKTIKETYISLKPEDIRNKFQEQDNWLDIYWVACEVNNETDSQLQSKLGKKLALVKTFRSTKTTNSSEEGFKCTLCGNRSTLDNAKINSQWYNANLKDNEKLCSVCATKRMLKATILDKHNINDNNRYGISTQDIGDSQYYSIIVADGDRMGEKMSSGEPAKISSQLINFSNNIWNISSFAENINNKKIINSKLIYCGGDDVLCLSPIRKTLNTANEIQLKFKELFDKNATMSAGIHISHGKESLGLALDNARKAEKQSKDSGRNCFTISVDKRAGDFVSWTAPWSKIEDLKVVIEYFEKGILSPSFAFQLKDEFFYFEKEIDTNMENAIKKRISYQLNRHYDEKKEKEINATEQGEKYSKEILLSVLKTISFKTIKEIKDFFYFLEIALFFARTQK